MNQDQRADFEAWARGKWPDISIKRYVTGKYVVTCLNYAFEAYQAALDSPEVQGLRSLSEEYSDLIRHMDAGGDFYEFMRDRAALAAMEKQK